MQVRYIGDPANKFEGPGEIDQYGYTFVKGEWQEVDDYDGYASKFKGNPTFQVEDSGRKEVETDAEADVDAYREALDARGVTYHKNAKAKALRKLLVDHVAANPESEHDDLPPVPAA